MTPQARPPFSGSTGPGPRRPDRDRNQRANAWGPRINERIRVPEVRVIGPEGEVLGVLETRQAIKQAYDAGLDLVEVNPKAAPPVCKIMDYGKFKYQEKKKAAEAKKKQTLVEVKEIKLRPKTDDHDLDVKVRHIKRFLSEGNKVKVTCRFRGREITHPEMAQRQLDFIADSVKDIAMIELSSRLEGKGMTLLLAPKAVATGKN